MYELFVLYEQALALKELGFDEKCIAYYGKQDTMMGRLKRDEMRHSDEWSRWVCMGLV